MSVQLFGIDTIGAANGASRPVAVKVFAGVISLMGRLAREVVHTIREDLAHGQIQDDPKTWERD